MVVGRGGREGGGGDIKVYDTKKRIKEKRKGGERKVVYRRIRLS